MQTANHTPAHQSAAVATAQPVRGPMLIAPELLQFIGGGTGLPPARPTPTAPKNTW